MSQTEERAAGPLDQAALAEQIYHIARYIFDRGNKGTQESTLKAAGLAVDALAYPALYDEILFHAEPQRKRDYNGWYVRKNPFWVRTWIDRFAAVCPEIARALIDDEHERALADDKAYEERLERLRLARPDSFALGLFEAYSDLELEYYYAALKLLEYRYQERQPFPPSAPPRVNVSKLLEAIVSREAQKIARELWFRRQPDLRKVNPDDVAYLFFQPRAEIFTREYRRQVVDQAAEPGLEVDLNSLPQQALSEKPIKEMSQWELLEAFMAWAGLEEPDNPFKNEDIQAMLRTLRSMFARAKGQHNAAESPTIESDEL